MSDAASWGSTSSWALASFPKHLNLHPGYRITDIDSQKHNSTSTNQDGSNGNSQESSALDKYIKQPETHEQAALGHGTTKAKKEVKKHEKKMKEKIKVIEKKLPK